MRYSIGEIVDENNNSYGIGVHLDSTLLEGLTPDERKAMVKERIKELGGEVFTAYDNNGNAVDITIAKPSANFRNHNGKKRPVNKDLTTKFIGDEVKQEAVVLIDELIVTSKFQGTDPAKHKHGWLDNNGQNDWDVWTTYIQDKNNTVWETTLHIANTANGEKIIYDVVSTKKVGQSGNSDTSPRKNSLTLETQNVKGQMSLSSSEDIAPMPRAGEVYGSDIGIEAQVREDLDSENVPESGTVALPDDFAPMAEDGGDIEITTTKQKLEAIRENSRKELARNEQLRQESHDRFTQKIEAAQALQMSNPFGNRKFFKKPTVHRIFHLQPRSK